MQCFPGRPEEVFDFFTCPAKVLAAYPPELHLRLEEAPERLFFGLRTCVRGRRWGVPHRAVNEVTAFEPGVLFVEEQCQGPFRRWIHTHRFEARAPAGARVSGTTSTSSRRAASLACESTRTLSCATWSGCLPGGGRSWRNSSAPRKAEGTLIGLPRGRPALSRTRPVLIFWRERKSPPPQPSLGIDALPRRTASEGNKLSMSLDLYSPCPCGSGKKFKWCCQHIFDDIEPPSPRPGRDSTRRPCASWTASPRPMPTTRKPGGASAIALRRGSH